MNPLNCLTTLLLTPVFLVACNRTMNSNAPLPNPPVAEKRAFEVPSPHGSRQDEYYWLRDDERKNPEMLAYLNAENAYTDAALAHTKPLQEKLYQEFIARLKQDDASVPYEKAGFLYYTRFETGQEYPVYARRAKSVDAKEEILLNANELSKGHDYYNIGAISVSPNGQLLAWAEDTVGRRQYNLRVMELASRRVLPLARNNVETDIVWANDNRTLLYIEKNPETLLGFRIRKHSLGASGGSLETDTVVWEQTDESFYTGIGRSKDDRYLLITTQSTVSSEVHFADANDNALRFKPFLTRERDHEYQVDHADNRWVVRTNWQARNFRIVEVAHGEEGRRERWRDLIAHRNDAFVDGFDVFKKFLAVEEHSGGLRKIRIRLWDGGAESFVTADEASYSNALDVNREFALDTVRYEYTSLVTPASIYDFNPLTGERMLLKQQPVLGGYKPADYRTELAWAPARDGARVPISLVYRHNTPRDGTAPLYVTAYGSYGSSNDPNFSSVRLSLLDRGFVIALAHIRGGQEMGRDWYENGKLLRKQNTFNDFVDVTRWLTEKGYGNAKNVFASGGSAGGLLMGAVANQAPELYRGIVSLVPFVDVVTTMLDESIPLTTNEFDEWGNPKQKVFYDYMLTYSPYDNIKAQAYPAIYVHSGLWDSQVQYFEPTKYVARLRARKTGDSPLLLRTNMEAGHGGNSGRFQRYREYAEQYAFMLDQAGIKN